MAVLYTFNVQYYTASGSLYGTYSIKFYDTNHGTEDTPEYYSSSPGLSNYTSAYVEDAFGEYLDISVLEDGSFVTSQDWTSVLLSATSPLKVYSSDFEGGGGGNTPSTGVLQGTVNVVLVNESLETIWEEAVNLYTAGDEYTPYIEGRLSAPQSLLDQYYDWSLVSGYYYDSFNNGYLTFYSWENTLFEEDLVIMGYGGGYSPSYRVVFYEDPTGYYETETESYEYNPNDSGTVEIYIKDWSGRTNANGENFLYWVDSEGTEYYGGNQHQIHSDLTLYAVWDTSISTQIEIVYYMSEDDSTIYTTDISYSDIYTIPSSYIPTREGYEFLYWDYPDNGESWYPGNTFNLYNNPVNLYGVWREIDPDAPIITGNEVYFVKVNGDWKVGRLFFKQGSWL